MELWASTTRLLCVFLVLSEIRGLLLVEELGDNTLEERALSKAILEMLHIDKLSAARQAKPHPYMKEVYQVLTAQQARDLSGADGTLVQSFRSIPGSKYGIPGWIWFNVSHLRPTMTAAELVLLRKTLHSEPLSVTVSVHGLSPLGGDLNVSAPLAEQLLTLDHLPPSGYDIFDVSAALAPRLRRVPEALGFQLQFGDESGSLVLHEALTQSLYCLDSGSLSQPLLVAYRAKPLELREEAHWASPQSSSQRPRQYCSSGFGRHHARARPQRSVTSSACRLHWRYVDVGTSELGRWILQPTGFNISFCRGACYHTMSRFPIDGQGKGKSPNAKDTYRSSSCVPEQLSSLTVMYRTGTDDVIIEGLKDVTALSCVCQPRNQQKKLRKHL